MLLLPRNQVAGSCSRMKGTISCLMMRAFVATVGLMAEDLLFHF